MQKVSIFSVLLVGSLLVSPIVTANNYAFNKIARASENTSNTSPSLLSSLANSSSFQSLDTFSSLFSNSVSSLVSSSQSEVVIPYTKKTKIITDVKPVKLNAQGVNWWKEADTFSGGNSRDLGIEAINTQIQLKLQTQCPNIYDSVAKTINESNLANCAVINSLPLQKIAIIDSGVTPNAEMLPFVDQVNSWNFFTSTNYPAICTSNSSLRFYTLIQGNSNIHYCKEKGTQSDTDYHGTTTAYTAIQIYKNSLLKNRIKIVPFSLRTLDTINISEAIDEVVRAGDIKTINLSIGTPYNVNYVETSITDAYLAGISAYASSGNCAVYSPSNCDYNGNTIQDLPEEANNTLNYPAAYLNAVMVGSSNYSDNSVAGIIRSTYSNFAKVIRDNFITAPVGNSGISLPCFTNCNGVANYSYLGTSFASPQAAGLEGLVAKYSELMKQNLGSANEKVLVSTESPKLYVTRNTTDILTAGNDLESGTGLINLKKISDKIVSELQTLNVPISSSSLLNSSSSTIVSSSSLTSSSSNAVLSSSSVVTASAVAKNTMINSIVLSSDNLSYIVMSTSNFIPAFGNDHIHFYYNTEANTVVDKMFSNAGPYNISVSTKPANATQLCTIVGTPSHGVNPNTGNCVSLPAIPLTSSSSSVSSSSILASSSNVLPISSSSTTTSSSQATPTSSSQNSSSFQVISSSSMQNSSSVISSSSQATSSVIKEYSSVVVINNSAVAAVSSIFAVTTSSGTGGGIISIISNIISNIINSLASTSANSNGIGNIIQNTSNSSISSNLTGGSKEYIKNLSTPVIVTLQDKNQEELAFVGLINNPNGVYPALQNDYDIKEQGVKSQKTLIGSQNNMAIKEQGLKSNSSSNSETDNRIQTSSITSSINSNNVCRKGWDGSIKGSIGSDTNISSKCPVVLNESCKKGITEKGLPLTQQEKIDCDGTVNDACRKGWDGSIKGNVVENKTQMTNTFQSDNTKGDGCIPVLTGPQSDINSGSDTSKYLPIVILAIVGSVGALVATSFVTKQKAWLKDTRLSSQISDLRKTSNNKHPDLMKVSQESPTDSLKTKTTESANKKEYVGHVTLNK
jgi:hypothetical protein